MFYLSKLVKITFVTSVIATPHYLVIESALLALGQAKCEVRNAVITYLAIPVGQGQVPPLSATVQAILDFFLCQKHSSSFIVFLGKFASLVIATISLEGPCSLFVWTTECQDSFVFQGSSVHHARVGCT